MEEEEEEASKQAIPERGDWVKGNGEEFYTEIKIWYFAGYI